MLYNRSIKDYISYLLSTLLKEASLFAKPQCVRSNFTHHEEPINYFRNSVFVIRNDIFRFCQNCDQMAIVAKHFQNIILTVILSPNAL